MTHLSWNEITDRAAEFASKYEGEVYEKGESQSFWSDFLAVYGIDRRRHGAFFEYAIKKGSGKQGFIDMFWPGKLLAEQKSGGKDRGAAEVQAWEYLETMPNHDLPQMIVVSDFAHFDLIATDTRQRHSFALADLPRHVKSFAFLIGESNKAIVEEQAVNRDAAEAMARLHNQLRDDNYSGHDLEVLLVRLVFCLFADDSGIFEHAQLHDFVVNRTSEDGSDLGAKLIQLFEVLNTPRDQRQRSLDEALADFEYINGGLFAESIRTPSFTAQMRRDLLAAMELNWSQVSPAIFGSMFQGVMDEQQRRNLGAHYTSEKNILRVIKPLFLDDLYAEFTRVRRSPTRLREFHDKLSGLSFLDPACGCGNFLVVTYRELRLLEHKVIAQLNKGRRSESASLDWLATSEHGQVQCDVSQMYGIEIEEFPSLIAQTALWLTDHQMNMQFSALSGKTFKRLPLTTTATIVHANALTTDWADVIAPKDLDFILGNPPFLGQTYQSKEQKQQVASVLSDIKKTGVLDFVSAWYGKATDTMKQNPRIQTALVSTNSITQGEQVSVLWQYLLEQGVTINFAHRTFKWTNDARGIAGVHCVIIGFALFDRDIKTIYEYPDIWAEPIENIVKSINPRLVENITIRPAGIANQSKFGEGTIIVQTNIVSSRSKPICNAPEMLWGNKPVDGGNLILSDSEKQSLVKLEPPSTKYIKPLISAREYLNNEKRWCLWLVDVSPNELKHMPLVLQRVRAVKEMRLASTKIPTQNAAQYPTLFMENRQPSSDYILIPSTTSENRLYIPMGFFTKDDIANNSSHLVINATLYHFGILTSQMHMAWMRAVAGRLESRYRYSKDIVYNNFIWPEVTEQQEKEVSDLAQAVLDARAEFPNSSLADLYDPFTMPPALAKAHHALDRAVDKLYRKSGFDSDPDRVAHLFELYEMMTLK